MRNTNYQSRSAQFNSLEASKPARWRRNAANLIAAAATSALLGVLSSSASATTTTLYWGGGTGAITNGTAPAGGSGNWDTSTSNWSQDPTLGTIYQAWPASGEAYSANFNKTAGTVTIDGTGVQADALIFSTTGYTIAGSALDNLTFIGVTPTVTTGAGITATINAPIAGFVGFTDAGGGTLALGGSNTYSGSTIVTGASTLLLNNTNAAQNSTLTEAVGGGSLSFASGVGTVNLAGLSWTDNIALTDLGSNAVNLSIGGYNTSSTYAGILSGGGSLTKVGSGMFTLSNTGAQLLTGNVTLNSGYLRVISSGLGSGTVTLAGGIFDLGSATANAYNNPVNVSGSSLIVLDRGVAGAGVTQTFGNLNINAPFVDVVSNAFTTSLNAGLTFGNVTLAAPTTLMVDASTAAPGTSQQTALTTGSITGNFNLNVATQNQATVTVNGSIGTMGDTSTLNKYGPGTLTIATGNALNSSGQVNITGGNLTLAGSTTALNVSNFVVNGGATLQLGTNGVTQVAQIGATANVTLNGGALYGASPSGTNLITTAGNLIIGPGESSLSGQGATGTGTHILQFNSITIGQGGVFNAGPEQNAYTTSDAIFLGNFATYGNGQSNATNPANPGMVNGVIVGMLFNGDFATVNTAPAALGSNPGGFPSLVPGSITSLDYNGPANNYGFYNGDLTPLRSGPGLGSLCGCQ